MPSSPPNNSPNPLQNPKLYIGCAVWSYKGWVGSFYPPKTQPRDFLSLYTRKFNTVEGNTTFYAVPQAKTVTSWSERMGEGFLFCPKLPKTITHQGLLEPKIKEADQFFQVMSDLQDNLGLVFAQLPPSYSPNYATDLEAFLSHFCDRKLALEVRHPQWFDPENQESLDFLLRVSNITKVLLDTRPIYNCNDDPQINSQRRKPKLPLQPVVTSDSVMVRFISHPQAELNQSYLAKWATQVKAWLEQDLTIYFFVHCPIEDYSPQTARYFLNLLEDLGVNIGRIGARDDEVAEAPTQLSLF